MKPLKLFIVVQPGLEHITSIELKKANINNFFQYHGGFELYGHNSAIYKLNNILRTISRILIRFAEFHSSSFWELEKNLKRLNWEEYINDQDLIFRINTRNSKLYHKEAVKERFIKIIDNRVPGRKKNDKSILLIINIIDDIIGINIDTTGTHLHKRNYNDWRSKAPLRETIASAMIISCRENKKSIRLLDPMCGAGTILMEAAAIDMNLPFFLFRNFAFEHFPSFQKDIYEGIKENLYNDTRNLNLEIIGMDINDKAIRAFTHNISRMNIQNHALILKRDNRTLSERELINSSIITNPPYGERLSNDHTREIIDRLIKLKKRKVLRDLYILEPLDHYNKGYERAFITNNGNIPVICIKY